MRSVVSSLRLSALVVGALGVAPFRLSGQSRPDSATYVVRIGRDTSLVEWIVRDGNRVRSLTVRRIPTVDVRRADVTLAPDGSVQRAEELGFGATTAPDAPPTDRTLLYRRGDSTVVESGLGPTPRRLLYPGGGHVINGVFFFDAYPVLATLRRPAVGDSAIGQHFPGALGARRLAIRRTAPNELTLHSNVMGLMRVTLDAKGTPTEFDGTGSSINYHGTRVPWLDPDSVVRAFVERQQAQGAAGALSPRDSTTTTVAGAAISLDYGRPSKRGREVFGGIVPWGRVWRTGANRATHFSSSRPLAFGDVVVPAGRYTLWSLPTPQGWTLIVNRQTGQWGTEYDARQDLARIPMAVRTAADPLEQLTLTVEQTGPTAGVVRIRWDAVDATATFVVR
jgi:hypothetical protein